MRCSKLSLEQAQAIIIENFEASRQIPVALMAANAPIFDQALFELVTDVDTTEEEGVALSKFMTQCGFTLRFAVEHSLPEAA